MAAPVFQAQPFAQQGRLPAHLLKLDWTRLVATYRYYLFRVGICCTIRTRDGRRNQGFIPVGLFARRFSVFLTTNAHPVIVISNAKHTSKRHRYTKQWNRYVHEKKKNRYDIRYFLKTKKEIRKRFLYLIPVPDMYSMPKLSFFRCWLYQLEKIYRDTRGREEGRGGHNKKYLEGRNLFDI